MLAAASQLESQVVTDLVLIFVSAAAVALIVRRLKLAVIPIYLITGALIGPHVLGLVRGDSVLGEISHLAVVLLLFGIGLELHLSVLRHNLLRMITIGVLSSALSIALGTVLLWLANLGLVRSLVIAMAFALSSTAVVMRIIVERRKLRHSSGRLSLSILVVQDILVVLMLALLPLLAVWNGADVDPLHSKSWSQLVLGVSIKIGGVVILVFLARKFLPYALYEAMKSRSTELMMLVGIACALMAAMATQRLGFSLELGAFLAGFILAGTPFRFHLGSQIGVVRDLFNALFFTTLGMAVVPTIVVQQWWVFVVGIIVLLAVKSMVIGFSCWSMGVPAVVAIPVGLSLAQAGEFSLILLSRANSLTILDHENLALCVSIIVASLIVTPGLVTLGKYMASKVPAQASAPWIKRAVFSSPKNDEPQQQRVIVAGYGPVGRAIVEALKGMSLDVTIVESNPSTHRRLVEHGLQSVFGDVGNSHILEEAGIHSASAVVLTFADHDATIRSCKVIKSIRADVPVACRVLSNIDQEKLRGIGVEYITVEEETVERSLKEDIKTLFA